MLEGLNGLTVCMYMYEKHNIVSYVILLEAFQRNLLKSNMLKNKNNNNDICMYMKMRSEALHKRT